jgi:uncharacterized protein (DUF1697 family)
MSVHVAFLRGVGGPRPAPGDALIACFAAAGYNRVRPVMSTGNVIFGSARKRKMPEEGAVSALLEGHFGYPLPAILRGGAAVVEMVDRDPFRGFAKGALVRFVALLAGDAPPADAFPEPARDAGYRLVERRDRDLYFIIDRERVRTPDLMARLDRVFRKAVTTRNWSTIERVAAALAGLP